MKRSIPLLALFLFCAFKSNAQKTEYPYANRNNGVLYMSEYDFFKRGQVVTLGAGTAPSGDFVYITKTLGKLPLKREYAGKQGEVARINWKGTPKKGIVFYLLIEGKDLDYPYEVELKNALASGEIVSKDPNLKKKESAINLVADELYKLKDLLDKGIITKEEFEAQKKKLLSQ